MRGGGVEKEFHQLQEQYGNDRKIIKEILAAQGKSIEVNTTFDELVSWVHEDEKGKKVR